MKKTSSSKGSRASIKKLTEAGPPVLQQKDDDAAEETDIILQQKDGDDLDLDIDNEEEEEEDSQPMPGLTDENMMEYPPPEDSAVPPVESSVDAAMSKVQGSAHEGTGTSISSQIQKIIARELTAPGKRGRIDLQSVPMKEYLEQTVIPIVHQGLLALARERPASPIEYLAAYFLKHKQKYQNDQDHDQVFNTDQDNTDNLGNVQMQNENLQQQQQQGITDAPPVSKT